MLAEAGALRVAEQPEALVFEPVRLVVREEAVALPGVWAFELWAC